MYKNNCKCGSDKFYLQYKGYMVGKYCSGCNKWQRWVGKKDLEAYKRNGYTVFKEDNSTKYTSNATTTTFKPCNGCGSDKFYLRYKGEMVGKYCESCDKWSTWVGKKVLDELLFKGYSIKEESYENPNIVKTVEPSNDIKESNKGVNEVHSCPKCGNIGFYIKARGCNVGKYCDSCNKWIKWVSKSDVKIMQSQGIKIQSDLYMVHSNNTFNDNNRYVDHSDVYVSEYNKKEGIEGVFSNDKATNSVEPNKNMVDSGAFKDELNIVKNDTNIIKTDTNIAKNDINTSNLDMNIKENKSNISLLEQFISKAPVGCSGCILESKCDMMIVKLCDSIVDAIEYVKDSEVF